MSRCDFQGCTNESPGLYPGQMCDPCYQSALEVEDSEMELFDLT